MIYDFTADDVFEMAEQLERNGDQFYREAAQNTDNPEYKKLLVGLADMETACPEWDKDCELKEEFE